MNHAIKPLVLLLALSYLVKIALDYTLRPEKEAERIRKLGGPLSGWYNSSDYPRFIRAMSAVVWLFAFVFLCAFIQSIIDLF